MILVRLDLKLPKGKLAAQVAHASSEAVMRSLSSNKEAVKDWRRDGQKKVVLKVSSEEDLYKYNQQAKDSGLVTALITDAGKTVIAPGTVTVLGIGPDDEEKINKITGELGML